MDRNAHQIPERELAAYRARIKLDIFKQIYARFLQVKSEGATQRDIADRLGMDEGQLSRTLKGEQDIRLETLSDLARALDCRIFAQLRPLEAKVEQQNAIGEYSQQHGHRELPRRASSRRFSRRHRTDHLPAVPGRNPLHWRAERRRAVLSDGVEGSVSLIARTAHGETRLQLKATGGERDVSVFVQAEFLGDASVIQLTIYDENGAILWIPRLSNDLKFAEKEFERAVSDVEGWSIECESVAD